MCSNFEPVTKYQSGWVGEHFGVQLPQEDWRAETFPTYKAPFIYLSDGIVKCDLAQFGLVPHWAKDKKKFGLKTYNARSETVAEKPSYRSAWSNRRFGLILTNKFYEPSYETGKAVRAGIFRSDGEPTAIASIWERFVDTDTGEVIHSFSMLTLNADAHPLMSRFHKPNDEKRSVVVIENGDFLKWLNATQEEARSLLKLPSDGYLDSTCPSDLNIQISIFE